MSGKSATWICTFGTWIGFERLHVLAHSDSELVEDGEI